MTCLEMSVLVIFLKVMLFTIILCGVDHVCHGVCVYVCVYTLAHLCACICLSKSEVNFM